jgi:hypothetical protein
LSEYLALKYGPQVVYMDFRDFLVLAYIHGGGGGVALAYPLCKIKSIAEKIKDCPSLWLGVALKNLGVAFGLHLGTLEGS